MNELREALTYIAMMMRMNQWDKATELLKQLGEPLMQIGQWNILSQMLDSCLIHYPNDGDLHLYRGRVYDETGFPDQAMQHLTRALSSYKTSQDYEGQVTALIDIGLIYEKMGQYNVAARTYEHGTKITNDEMKLCVLYSNLGNIYGRLGNFDQAQITLEKSLSISRRVGADSLTVKNYLFLGNISRSQGNFESAKSFFMQSLALSERIGDFEVVADSLHNLGATFTEEEDYEKAMEMYEKSLSILQRLGGHQPLMVRIYGSLGTIHIIKKNITLGIDLLEKGIVLSRQFGYEQDEATCLSSLASAYQDIGQVGRAIETYRRALELQERIGDRLSSAGTFWNLGRLYKEQGDVIQAKQTFNKAKDLYQQLGLEDRANLAAMHLMMLEA